VSRIVETLGRRLPRGWGDVFAQLGLFVLADLCYETVRGLAEGRAALAYSNAERIIEIERATGTFFEPGLQGAILGHQWLVEAANWAYMNTHFVITTAFLVWLYLFRNEAFYFVRNMFLVAMALLVVVTMFYFFRDGENLRGAIYDIVPLEYEQSHDIVTRTREVCGAEWSSVRRRTACRQ
jgi:hypothetical protein